MNLNQMVEEVINRSTTMNESDKPKIINWINEGYLILSRAAKIYAEATTTINANTGLYQLPDNFIKLENVKIGESFLQQINEEDTNSTQGPPTYYYKQGNKLGFYPVPNADMVAKVVYFKYPDKLVEDDDKPVPEIREEYHGAIINFAIARSLEADEEIQNASYFMAQFEKSKQELEYAVITESPAIDHIQVV